MNPVLLGLAERYFLGKLMSGDFPFTRTSRTASWLRTAAGLLGIVGTGFLIVAMYYWLDAHYAPDMAALIAAASVFALALLAAGVAGLMAIERRSRLMAVKAEVKKNLAVVFETLDTELGQPVRENPALSVALAALAGYMVTDRIT